MNPKSVHETTGYSHVGYFDGPGRVVYISGRVARNEKGETVGIGDVEEQTRRVYQNLSSILSSMGGNLGNVIKLNIYTTRLDQVSAIRKVRGEFFAGKEMPWATLVGVTGLVSGFLDRDRSCSRSESAIVANQRIFLRCESSLFECRPGSGRDCLDQYITGPPPFSTVRRFAGDHRVPISPAGKDQGTDPHRIG